MADLDIAERRVPQDGRIGLTVGGKAHRHARGDAADGVRREDRHPPPRQVQRHARAVEDVGFEPDGADAAYKGVHKALRCRARHRPDRLGQVDDALRHAQPSSTSPSKNIITVEDPVEYRLQGINQVQVNVKAGLTFASGLRSILRCDPDIVMVGEIRDKETAQIAIESALTGHLVLCTLHTNDAAGALSRLTEMGVEPFLTARRVDGVLAQRLARRLCKECRVKTTVTHEVLMEIGETTSLPRGLTGSRCRSTRPVGAGAAATRATRAAWASTRSCRERRRSAGWRSRKRKSADEIAAAARRKACHVARRRHRARCSQGVTTLEEIARRWHRLIMTRPGRR